MNCDADRFDIPADVQPERLVNRNVLLSTLLQDRGVVRLLSAPHGFGKTVLAYEYATRLFSPARVHWIDASAPDFLAALDEGKLLGFSAVDEGISLIVVDGLPWLHEQRAAVFAHLLDTVLFEGVEVLVTTLPSTDCLRDLQPDRMLIRAEDLLVTERECLDARSSSASEARARAARAWRRAERTFMGRVPCVAWGDDATADAADCLAHFLGENLPHSMLQSALAILLLGAGGADDLELLGISLHGEDAAILLHDYPFLGLDGGLFEFDVTSLPLSTLSDALKAAGALRRVTGGTVPLAERVLALLLDRGAAGRAEELLGLFCSDQHCAAWLSSRGFDLLDQGQFDLVEALFDRCPEQELAGTPELQALRAWASGMQGDTIEARMFSLRVLAREREQKPDSGTFARMLAYLALEAFDEGASVLYGKEVYADGGLAVTPGEFLMCAVDLCEETEVGRALCPDGSERAGKLEKERSAATHERSEAIVALFTGCHDRLKGTLAYRLALHLLAYVDDVEVRKVLQGLGCDVVVTVRHNGLRRYSEALLVRDLWKSGYFGLVGARGGKKDARLLEEAARMLRGLAEHRDAGAADIPWEAGGKITPGAFERRTDLRFRDNVEIMHVRLFGCFEVSVGERFVKEADFRKKARLVFMVLAVNQGRDVSRDALLEQLWPDSTRTRALDSFYTVWSNITAILGEEPYLERNGDFCRINPRYVISDVGEFERLSRQLLVEQLESRTLLDIYAHIESLYRGDLAPGEVGNRLVDAQRVRYRAMFVDSMVSASSCALKVHDARLALWFARKAMETDGRREDVYFSLMRAQVAAGQRCSAIRTYFECCKFLKDEMGLDPSCETKDLYDRLITVDPSLLRLDADTFRI